MRTGRSKPSRGGVPPKAPAEEALTTQPALDPEQAFALDICTLLDHRTVQLRPQHINVLLRLSMMTGLQMQLEATLRLLCEFSHEIVPFERSLVYLWTEAEERSTLRVCRGVEDKLKQSLGSANIFDFWTMKSGRPLLVHAGKHLEADRVLKAMEAGSALIVPVLVSNRVMGTMQFFHPEPHAFSGEDAQLLYVLSRIAENLLNREYTNEGLIHFAFTDHLTGLKTRGFFEQQLELEIKRFERRQEKFVLLMLDIDHFKQLNDTFGHHIGDRVLREIANILAQDMRDVDTVARYGGEEFAIILPETTAEEAVNVAQRIRARVEEAEYSGGKLKNLLPLSISIGLAVFDDDAKQKRELVQSADAALYWAKSQGRNRVVTYAELKRHRQNQKEA